MASRTHSQSGSSSPVDPRFLRYFCTNIALLAGSQPFKKQKSQSIYTTHQSILDESDASATRLSGSPENDSRRVETFSFPITKASISVLFKQSAVNGDSKYSIDVDTISTQRGEINLA